MRQITERRSPLTLVIAVIVIVIILHALFVRGYLGCSNKNGLLILPNGVQGKPGALAPSCPY